MTLVPTGSEVPKLIPIHLHPSVASTLLLAATFLPALQLHPAALYLHSSTSNCCGGASVAASPELPKGGPKGPQVPEMQTWPEPIPCSCVSFNLLQGFYAFLYLIFFLSGSPFLAFSTLNLLSTELKPFSLKPLEAVLLLLTLLSCEPKIHQNTEDPQELQVSHHGSDRKSVHT